MVRDGVCVLTDAERANVQLVQFRNVSEKLPCVRPQSRVVHRTLWVQAEVEHVLNTIMID